LKDLQQTNGIDLASEDNKGLSIIEYYMNIAMDNSMYRKDFIDICKYKKNINII